MVKHDIGHMGCPYYEEKINDSLTVVFIPRKSELKSAVVYIGQGGFLHAKEIASSKIPFGTAYYLKNMICSDDFKNKMLEDGVLLESDMDYSFVRYSLNTLGDIYEPLKNLLERIAKPCFDEKMLDEFKVREKDEAEKRENDPILLSQKECIKNLYISSPIRYGFVPSYEDGKRIHASVLKKYQETYYVQDKVVLFLSLDEKPEVLMKKMKPFKLSSNSSLEEKKLTYEEDYEKVREEYTQLQYEGEHSYLTYGIKFPGREIIYNSYGELSFTAYEILLDSITASNSSFKESLADIRANLVSSKLKEGGEDTYLLLTFQTEDEESLISFLTQYFSKLDTKVTLKEYKELQQEVFTRAIKELYLPNVACKEFSRAYPNHVPYTSLMAHVMHLSFNSYRRFLQEFKSFKKAVCFVKKGN